MKAVLCRSLGGPDDLVIADVPPAQAHPGEAVVAIAAVGLNFFDTLMIAGSYQVKPPLPFSPGGEFAGVVTAVAPDVAWLKPGERVIGYAGFGAAREEIAIEARWLARIPDSLSDETAAGLAITYGTALHALKDRAGLKPGETIAVLGASGGVGQAAVEIAKLMGAHVIACASSPQKLDFCRSHGADALVDYQHQDMKWALKSLTDGRGVDVIYDPVGGGLAEPALRAIAWGGRYLVIGFAAGEIPKLPLNLVLLKGCDIRGVYWGEFVHREPDAYRAHLDQLLAWAAAGRIRPHVHKAWPLERAADALHAIARRQVMGKAILTLAR